MQFNFWPIKSEMVEDFKKVLDNRAKKIKKQLKFALGCRGEELNKDIWDAIFNEINDVTSTDIEKINVAYIQMLNKIDGILGQHIC